MSEAKYIKNNMQYEIHRRTEVDEVRKVPLWMLIPLMLLMVLGGYLVFNGLGVETKGLEEYKVAGEVDYQVYLKDNDYYNEKFLGPGKQYIASLINVIRADFDYALEADEAADIHYSYDIIAEAKATEKDDKTKVLYEKSDTLKTSDVINAENGTIKVEDSVDIDYGKYNELMKSFRTDFGISANCLLSLKLIVKVDGAIKTEDTLAMTIPLTDQTLDITMDTQGVNREEKVGTGVKELYVKNLPVLIVGAILIVASLAAAITLICLYKTRFGNNWYAKALHEIFKKYDTNIVNISENFHEDGEVRRVNSFVELLDAANNEGAPILFCEVVPDHKAYFVVEGATTIYRYTLTQAYQQELRRSGEKREIF